MIKRDLFDKIKDWIGEEKILIIKGARQTGKTTLLLHIQEYIEEKGSKAIYFSVDQDLQNPIFSDAKLFLQYFLDQHKEKDNKLFILLDEFQYIDNAGLFLKNIFDQKKKEIQLIVSGSSSLEITKNSEFLTGRKVDFHLQPFSFLEVLRANSLHKYNFKWTFDQNIDKLKDFYNIYKKDLEQHLLDYVNWGGYPEVVTTKNQVKKEVILNEITKTYIEKDIVNFLHIENIMGFNFLIKVLSDQVGNLLNKNELSNTLSLNIRTINKYLDVLEGTFIFSYLKPYFSNKRKELTKTSKVYVQDLGIARSILKYPVHQFGLLSGNLIENFVFNELNKKFHIDNLNFYRTLSGSKIDFIINKQSVVPIEVKYRNNVNKLPVALKNFSVSSVEKDIKKRIILTKNDLWLDEDCLAIPTILLPFLELNI